MGLTGTSAKSARQRAASSKTTTASKARRWRTRPCVFTTSAWGKGGAKTRSPATPSLQLARHPTAGQRKASSSTTTLTRKSAIHCAEMRGTEGKVQGRVLFHAVELLFGKSVDWGEGPHAVRLHGRPRVHGLRHDQSQWEGRTTVQRGDVELFHRPELGRRQLQVRRRTAGERKL